MSFLNRTENLHTRTFQYVQQRTEDWLPGLAARVIFSSALMVYFINAALTKVGDGVFGFLVPQPSAYIQILPSVMESYGYNASAIPFFPYGIIVYLGTYTEFLLPVLILLGLFTRLSSLAMVGFIFVLSFVDIAFHGVDASTIGTFFDRVHDSAILDQRLLWLFPLIYLIIRGPGTISADYLLGRFWTSRQGSTS